MVSIPPTSRGWNTPLRSIEGVDTFLASWTDLLTSVEQALTTARTESQEDGQ